MLDQAWNTIASLYGQFGALAADYPILGSLLGGLRGLAIVFVVVFVLEWLTGGNLRRYWTRNFRTDMTYGIFYFGGIYNALIYVPVIALLATITPDWHFRLLDHVPGLIGFAIYWLVADAAEYWIHRWYHSNSLLWTFHKVHHTQTELTFVTSFRNHVVEQLFANVVLFVPLMVLGLPLWYWGPAYFSQIIFEGLQHSDIKWRYGRLYPIFVSPVFHAIHHSPERSQHDSNYSKIFSFWDYLFGTMSSGERPLRYGLAGTDMPVSFVGTMAAPFIELWLRAKSAAERPGKSPA